MKIAERNCQFAILIPTRERPETLVHTVRACLNQDYERLQVIISDNNSQDATRDVAASFRDSRLKYVNTGRRVSMSENFEYGLSHVADGYVMCLGDDDGIIPQALRHVGEVIGETGSLAVASAICTYTWPEFADRSRANVLAWSHARGFEIRESKRWLDEFFSFRPLYTFDLPNLYCGFVRRDIIARATRNGVFFRSQTPDAYAAFAIAHQLDTYALSLTPFAIHGASSRSNGSSYLGGQDRREADAFIRENTIPFHDELVLCPSYRVIALEAFLQFSAQFPESANRERIDWCRFLRAVLTEVRPETANAIESAVRVMASRHGVDPAALDGPAPRDDGAGAAAELLRPVWRQRAPSQNYHRVANTTLFGVSNVYDASLLLGFFDGLARGHAERLPGSLARRLNRVRNLARRLLSRH